MEAVASVLPEPLPPPTFKKPVPMTPPLTAFDPGSSHARRRCQAKSSD